jgi:hypothetical protein
MASSWSNDFRCFAAYDMSLRGRLSGPKQSPTRDEIASLEARRRDTLWINPLAMTVTAWARAARSGWGIRNEGRGLPPFGITIHRLAKLCALG